MVIVLHTSFDVSCPSVISFLTVAFSMSFLTVQIGVVRLSLAESTWYYYVFASVLPPSWLKPLKLLIGFLFNEFYQRVFCFFAVLSSTLIFSYLVEFLLSLFLQASFPQYQQFYYSD